MKILGKKKLNRKTRLAKNEKICSIVSVAAYNPDSRMFITLDNEAGFAWLCEPVCYEDENIIIVRDHVNGLLARLGDIRLDREALQKVMNEHCIYFIIINYKRSDRHTFYPLINAGRSRAGLSRI